MHTETIKLIYSPVSLLIACKQTNEQQKDEPDTQILNTTKIKQLNFVLFIFIFCPWPTKTLHKDIGLTPVKSITKEHSHKQRI